VIEFPNADPVLVANAKLNLGDYYLMQAKYGRPTACIRKWTKPKEDALGNEARYRNARLSYYDGDFQWAQAQFDILKAALLPSSFLMMPLTSRCSLWIIWD
jgi:hypothetical protein